MRLNRYIATYTDLSRRKADLLIEQGRVIVNRNLAHTGMIVSHEDHVIVDGKKLVPVKRKSITVLLNKPVGFVCSKNGQGSPTVYDLLQKSMQQLNIAGRLDKDSSGLVVLTNDGNLLQELSHPSYNKEKVYEVTLEKRLSFEDMKRLTFGIDIGDNRHSKLKVMNITGASYKVVIHEGRNRQIRRTFDALNYKVIKLHRIQLGPYRLGKLKPENFTEI